MIKLSYFPNLFIEAAVLFDQQAAAVFVGKDGAIGALMWSEVTNGGLIGHGRGEEIPESPKEDV